MLILFIIFLIAVFLVSIIFFVFIRKSESFKDWWSKSKRKNGEDYVARLLGDNVLNEKYVINNLIFEINNSSCEIDHIVITKSGILVIETKNRSGCIYGDESLRQWTQRLSNGKKHEFYNPIMQNASHINKLNRLLGDLTDLYCFTSIVVFPKAQSIPKNLYNVGNIDFLKQMLLFKGEYIFSTDQLNIIYQKLLKIKNNPTISNKQHNINVNQTLQKIQHNICPECGNYLVIKSSKTGKYYGCIGFPQCTFTKEIKN